MVEELRSFINECKDRKSCKGCFFEGENAGICGLCTCDELDINQIISDFEVWKEMCNDGKKMYAGVSENEKSSPEQEENDIVNHPSHYCKEGAMECIDELELVFGREKVMAFCECNVWKYRYRASDKNGQEDIEKSNWYIKKLKELKEKSKLILAKI